MKDQVSRLAPGPAVTLISEGFGKTWILLLPLSSLSNDLGAFSDRSSLEGSRDQCALDCKGWKESSVSSSPPPQQRVRMVMDEAEAKADWFLVLMDKVSHAS